MDAATISSSPNTNLPGLPIGRYRLEFLALDPIKLPPYSGSAWRGVFGHALKRLVCVTREPACPSCLLYRSCVYPYLFETPPDPAVGKLRKYTAAPHPFVLIPGLDASGILPSGAGLHLQFTLFGHGNRHLPYVIHALDQAGRRGMGKGSGQLGLQRVEQSDREFADWREIHAPGVRLAPYPATVPEIPPCPQRLTLSLETPLRLKSEGRNVTPENFHFGILFANLLRRISLLTAFHTDTPLETDFAALTRAARAIEVTQSALRWHDWSRYSSRQDTLMQMGGLLGQVSLSGEGLTPFWPYLWLGQWTHVGKGTSMGLGKYRIVSDS